jgi:hypothetical protein
LTGGLVSAGFGLSVDVPGAGTGDAGGTVGRWLSATDSAAETRPGFSSHVPPSPDTTCVLFEMS